MRIIFILVFVLALHGCKGVVPSQGETSSSFSEDLNASSSVMDENMHRGVDEDAVWHVIEAWTPDISWLAPREGTNTEHIVMDDTLKTILPGTVKTASLETTINDETFTKDFSETQSRYNLDAALKKKGWVRHLKIDADGPIGTAWGYRKDSSEGVRFLTVSAFCMEDVDDIAVACPRWKAKVEVTAAIP